MSGNSTSDDAAPTSVFERIVRSYNAAGFLPVLVTVLLVAFALFVPNFVAVQNLLNVLRSSSYLVIIAAGQMLVLIVGGFDLSQGAVVALTSVSSALVMAGLKDTFAGEPSLIILIGILAGLGCGAIVGLVNGACVAFLRISPFMVTLGTMSIATGVCIASDQRHSRLWHAEKLCRRLRPRSLAGAAHRILFGRRRRCGHLGDAELYAAWAAISLRSAETCRPRSSPAYPPRPTLSCPM